MPSIALRLEQVGGPPLPETSKALSGLVLIGRERDADIVLPDAQISRRHCVIEQREQETLIVDLDSQLGTLLNDVQLPAGQAVTLSVHDRVRIGPWRFRVRSGFDIASDMLRDRKSPHAKGRQTLSGKTQLGAPILAAERRLELLVEFTAAAVEKNTPALLAAVTLDFAQRGSNAQALAMFAPEAQSFVALAQLGSPALSALPEAFAASAKGGLVQFETEAADLPGLCLALRVDGEAVAYVLLQFSEQHARDKSESAEFLHALARMSALAWAQLERKQVQSRLERLRDDLERARETQARLLPPVAGHVLGLQYAFHLLPGRSVAGDLLDVFAIDASRLGIIFGDVSGAGFGAGMLMASVQAYLHAELMETADPALAAARANRYAARVGSGRFVTAWIAVFDSTSKTLTLVDAGHGLAWRQDAKQLSPLKTRGGPPLGVDAQASFDSEILQLLPHERIIVLSDGVTEHRAAGDSGLVRFESKLTDYFLRAHGDIGQQPAQLFEALQRFGGRLPDDDATALFFALS
jgi:serine phosphatase RsbU (regulator of sigma subunit)